MKKIVFAFVVLIISINFSNAQEKKKIDHTIYDEWKSFGDIVSSNSGNWIAYEINPSLGDGTLFFENTVTGQKQEFFKGKNPKIESKERFGVFLVDIGYDTTRQLKLDKVDKKKWVQDTLGVYYFNGDSTRFISGVGAFEISEEGEWIAYMLREDKTPDCPTDKKSKKNKKNPCVKPNTTGKTLVVWNPLTNETKEFHGVLDFEFDKEASKLAIIRSHKGEEDTLSVNIVDLTNWNSLKIIDHQTSIKSLTFNEAGNNLVYLSSNDTNKLKNYTLKFWSIDQKNSTTIVDSLTNGMPNNHTVSQFRAPYFSKDGSKIYFGTNTIVRQVAEDTLLETEKAKVDVWSWNDPFIQPGQLLMKSVIERDNFLAVYQLNNQEFVQLADSTVKSVQTIDHANKDFGLGKSTLGYEMERTWEYPWKSDYYKIDFTSGNRTILKKGITSSGDLSPSGQVFVWFNPEDSAWFGLDVNTGQEINLTKNVQALFSDDNNGVPYAPEEVGTEGWIMLDNKEYYVVKDRFDLWALNPKQEGDVICLTGNWGKQNQVHFNLVLLESDSAYIQLDKSILYGTEEESQNGSYWSLNRIGGEFLIEKKLESAHKLAFISKAKKSDMVFLRRMNFTNYGEIEVTNLNFERPKAISNISEQQESYNWGTVEIVEWSTFSGIDLRGLLYKPEDFDSTKSYPMIVYFYEKYIENIHNYYAPRATASIIYPTEYVSNGYIVFIPDVVYEAGHPAASAYDCIVSGTEALYRKNTWIDSTRLGLQGQSWGGYQTAQLITMTGKYKAAMAGAPVSNMFSAYGGVRWGSGYSRMFQYERGQSRIGYTIWEKPELYFENSPIFGLPNVSTPLLIMHNDGDGAVPWYQGIEMYMGLRRLNQPVWLLNYNDDDHNLTKLANKKDLSIRMRQFFDYYLLGTPMPYWMLEGVPAVNKGINPGYELIQE